MSFHTPTRSSRPSNLPATPESQVLSSPIASFSSPTPNYWGTPAGGIWPPASTFATQLGDTTPLEHHKDRSRNFSAQDSGKRGRPRADLIAHLIRDGTSSPSGIKCRVCNRVFPREKSLQVSDILICTYLEFIFPSLSRLICEPTLEKDPMYVTIRDALVPSRNQAN